MLIFQGFKAFQDHLENKVQKVYEDYSRQALDVVGDAIATDARDSLGTYQSGIGEFSSWAKLAPSTIAEKARRGWGKGGNPDTPLYATGQLAASISYAVLNARRVEIGSNDEKLLWLDLGTKNMPPRPVLGPAALRTIPKHVGVFGFALAGAISGVPPSFHRRSP